MYQSPIVMLDFETTGLSPRAGARITEVAALRIVGDRVVDRFVSLVNCGVVVPPFITALTGITQEMVDGAPPASTVVPELLRFIGSDALAAHNASFDEKFLHAESALLGTAPRHSRLLCSLKLSRRLLPGLSTYRLSSVSSALGIVFRGDAHRAEADAAVSAELLIRLGARLCERYGQSTLELDLLAQIARLSAARVPAFLDERLRC